MENNGFWEYNFRVRSFDVDQNNNMTLTSISEYLQEVAGDHANTMGFGYRQVVLQQMAWILGGIKIEVERLPLWEEEIRVKTWVVENNRFTSRRDFQWYDQAGNVLVNASTNWILLNTERRRPVAIDSMNFQVTLHPEQKATSSEVSSIRAKFDEVDSSEYQVRYSDLDMVGHMNNTKYIQLFLDYYTPDFHNSHQIKSLDINFKNEAQYQDKLELSVMQNTDSHLIELKRNKDGKVNCLASLVWESENQ
jgi:acyl-ACP thioesterase